MNPPVTVTIAHADPNAAPLTINELIDVLNPLLSSVIQGSYIPYVISNSTPAMEDTDKAWIQLDSAGRPVAIKIYYTGHWRRIYNGMRGEVRAYSGAPGAPLWDSDGRGIVEQEYDGWQICNGKNGSPDLSDRFIVGAHMNESSGWDGAKWLVKITPASPAPPTFTQTGGAVEHLIVKQDLPPINPNGPNKTPPEQTDTMTIHGFAYKDGGSHTPPAAIVDTAYSLATPNDLQLAVYGANITSTTPQTTVPTMPPYYALAYIIFQGY